MLRSTCLLLLLAGVIPCRAAYTPPAAAGTALDKLRSYSELTSAAGTMNLDTYTYNLTTWQMTHGGFSKAHAALYVNRWDGAAALSSWTGTKSEALGMFDNNATVQEMRLLAVRYKATTVDSLKKRFKSSFLKATGFVLASQLPNGGWPQVYPKRGNYSDMATYNDNAMVRVMVMVKDMVDKKVPFDSDIATDSLAKLKTALNKAVDFALKAQIVNSGNPTVWCAQHDPSSYAAVGARSYELASKSGSESAGVVWFLMNWPDQTAAVQKAVKGAIAWYKKNKVTNLAYSSGTFTATTNGALWYRFYEVANDSFFFCDRDGISTKTQDITKLSEDRRTGYQWAGNYGSGLLDAEAAYLTALGGVVGIAGAAHPREAFLRIEGARLQAEVPMDGVYQLRVLDAAGALRATVSAQALGGRLEANLPATAGTLRVGFVTMSRIGSADTYRQAFVRP